jgi:thiol:disulfide interchange protein DsbD
MAAFALALTPLASNAQTGPARSPKVEIELLAEQAAIRPGDKITVALRQIITPGWHTYWTNPGDSGEPTRIDWTLPPGASAGPIQWPLPHAIPVGPLMNFGYSDEILLLTDIAVPLSASGAHFTISADVKWLVCEEICIPEEAVAELSLPLIDGAITPLPSPSAKAIRAARDALPEPMPWAARFDLGDERVRLRIENVAERLAGGSEFRFFPLEWGHINHAAPQRAVFDNGDLILDLARGDFTGNARPVALDGVIAVETRGANGNIERRGYSLSAAPSEVPIATPGGAAPPQAGGTGGGLSLAMALGFALLGGLILNLMPCVFPVLSLKALSLAKDAGNSQVRRTKGLVYLAGVLASFALIGAVLIALRGGGEAIGWGTQFQSPAFILAMMALFLALALNLSGVFAIGGSVAGLGDSLTRRSGLSGYFFTGVLATVVATPCTAPFMGAAMGYAFTQPAVTVFAVLLALGLGFALPIVLLSLTPALGRWLPKPGPWMETFKQLMAFPLYATVAWLVWVISIQQGSDGVVAASITLLGVGFAAWLIGYRAEIGTLRGGAAALIAVLAIGLGWSVTGPAAPQAGIGEAASERSGPRAEAFTQARLDELIGQNRPVFVNLTAAWCITCKVNERVALRSQRVADAFRKQDIAYLVGDWTNGNAEITELLKAHGRVGVPLYLLYSGTPGAAPRILPQLLTESMVLDRLAELPSSPLKQAKGEH